MSMFILFAVLLAVLALGAVFAPLLRDRPAIGGALVAASLATVAALYLLVGTPLALEPAVRESPKTLAEAVEHLERELERDPRQPEGWRLLADAYLAQGRTADVARAYARAVELDPRNPDLLVQAAEARTLANGTRRFDAEAVALLERALEAQPVHQRARWFLGIAKRQAGDAAGAANTWEPLLGVVGADTSAVLRPQIDAARAEAGLPPLPQAESQQPAAPEALTLQVDIHPALRARLPADAAVFVLAREPGGAPMPVAARRVALAELPASVRLTDADSPMATRRLSQLQRVEVLARASASGVANARAGDLESAPVLLEPGGEAELRIDRVRP